MNKAQKRTWCKLAVSILGLMVMSGALTIMKIYNLEMREPQDHNAIRMLGLLNTTPLDTDSHPGVALEKDIRRTGYRNRAQGVILWNSRSFHIFRRCRLVLNCNNQVGLH